MFIPQLNIFWDWNGTLLNDTDICLKTMNNMLSRRGMNILTIDSYKELFGFPVENYYRSIGFDFSHESFENLSVEFIASYNNALHTAPLVSGAEKVLSKFIEEGKRNIIISAMRQDMLAESVHEKGLKDLFFDIMGIETIYASSKSTLAVNYVKEQGISPDDILFIGDTVHDYEVASAIGCKCLLIADGHQNEARLRMTGAMIVSKLSDLLEMNS